MAAITVQVPTAQLGWFEQMIQTMGWTFDISNADVATASDNTITPAMRRRINRARKEYAEGKTITCKTPQEMQDFFDSL